MKEAALDPQYARFPEISRQEMQKFMQWIRTQPHIASDFSEAEALHFFYACRFSMEMSKQVLDCNLTARTHIDEFFCNLDCEKSEIKRAMKTVAVVPLPTVTPEGYQVVIGKLTDVNPSHFNYADVMKLYCMVFDMMMYEDGLKPGYLIVMDLKGCTLGHIARIGLLQMKKFLYYLQEAAAICLVGFHFINTVSFMDKILALMTPFMKKELTSMLHMHNSLEDFYKFVPREILPMDYNGPLQPADEMKEIFYKKLRANRNDMLAFEKRHQVNEKLRPGKPKNASDLFGIEGNFKKLDID